MFALPKAEIMKDIFTSIAELFGGEKDIDLFFPEGEVFQVSPWQGSDGILMAYPGWISISFSPPNNSAIDTSFREKQPGIKCLCMCNHSCYIFINYNICVAYPHECPDNIFKLAP